MCLPAIPVAAAAAASTTAAASTAAATTAAVTAAAASSAAAASAVAAGGLTFTAAAGAAAAGGATLTNLALGASLLSGAVGAYGAFQQGQQNKSMNEYQSKVLQQQQVLAQRNAAENTTIVQNQAADQSKALARKAATIRGAQEAANAANGTAGSVTANDIALDTFDAAKLDHMSVQYNANLKTWGIQEGLHGEQWKLGVEGQQLDTAAKNAERAGYINAGASLLSSASQIANNRLFINANGRGY